MKKKLIVLMMAGVLALGMAGCGSDKAESTSGQEIESGDSQKEAETEKEKEEDVFYEVTGSNEMYAGMSARDTAKAALDYINENVNCITSYMYNSGFECDRYEQYNYVDGKFFFQSKTVEDEGGTIYELLYDENFVPESSYWFDEWTNYFISKDRYLEDEGDTGKLTYRELSNDAYKSQYSYQGVLLWLADACEDSDITRQDDGDSIIISISYQGMTNVYTIQNGMIVSLSDADNVQTITFTYYNMPEGRQQKVLDLYENGTGKTVEEVDKVLGF